MLPATFIKNIAATIVLSAIVLGALTCEKELYPDPVSSDSITEFETRLDNLRKQSNIPGMVAGIVRDGNVVWTKSYGFEDVSKQKIVDHHTIFHLASLTKTFASTVILQLLDEGMIDLNAPVSEFGINLTEKDTVRVIHLLTHTSQGVPGSQFKYNGDRYALLSNVIASATSKPFHQHVYGKIVQPLGLQNTAPSDMKLAASEGLDTIRLQQHIAQGYDSDGKHAVNYPKNFSAAAGLISNIDDMLSYANSFDGNVLLPDEMKEKIFSPMISNDGKTLPYGLGWFVQEKEEIKITWHYGYWTGMSSLIIRVPEQKISFVLLANSDMLSAPFPLGNGDIWVSPYAKEFLKSFVLEGAKLK